MIFLRWMGKSAARCGALPHAKHVGFCRRLMHPARRAVLTSMPQSCAGASCSACTCIQLYMRRLLLSWLRGICAEHALMHLHSVQV